MMKILTIILLLTLSLDLLAQDKIVGRYRNYFGSRIQLNVDNTFKYTWNFDMAGSWTKGTWTLSCDTVYFHMVPTYDTLMQTSTNGRTSDTFILSTDEVSNRITQEQYAGIVLSSGGQNRTSYPEQLVFKRKKLYEVKNGKLVKKKNKGFWTKKKWSPWFFKSED